MDEKSLNLAAAVMDVVKMLFATGVIIYILASNVILGAMAASGDEVMIGVAGAMKVMLIAFLVMCAAGLIQSIITLVIILRGDQDSDFGMRFIKITGTIKNCGGHVIQFVMGTVFAVIGVWSMTGAGGMIKEGDETGFLIVGGIFAIAGAGCAISAIIGIVKTAKEAMSA